MTAMKRINIIAACLGMLVMASCEKAEEKTYYVEDLVIDTEHCIAEGSYVQGVSLAQTCTVTLNYENASGGTAEFSAPKSNGMEIVPQTHTLEKGSGSVSLKVSGTPLELKITYLQINVKYNGKTYISSVEINVLEDQDPSGEITFSVAENKITSLLEPVTVSFTVTPTMAAVSAEAPEGLRVNISSDKQTGEGTITLTPSSNFLSGEVKLTASFGAREEKKHTVAVNAFESGAGTVADPWVVSNEKTLDKLRYGLEKAYVLKSDIAVSSQWNPVGTVGEPFNGNLDGAGKAITFNLSTTEKDAAFIAYAGSSAVVSSLKLKGSVEGTDYVAALAAHSEAAISADVSEVSVLGDNHIAASVADGAGKDDTVIVFAEVPSTLNFPAGIMALNGALGLSGGADIVFDAGSTGVSMNYDKASGNYTLTRTDGFEPGTVSIYARIGSDNVRSRVHSISVTSKKMFESGTGTAGDPYIVLDYDQLAATIGAYPSACVKLGADADIAAWTTLDSYPGELDGGGHKVSGLKVPFANNLSGKITNIAFTDVDITAGGTNCGVLANNLSGTVSSVSVSGKMSAGGASAGDTGLAAIAGQASGAAVISDCYTNVEIVVTGTNFATSGVVGVIKASSGITIANCTVAGAINISSNATKVGGVLGRKTNTSQTSNDIIKDCLITSAITVSGTGSNMVGGVFGALQGATVSGDYVGGLTIVRTAFTGAVSAGTAVGGICGVGCSATDCFVSGSVQATNNTGSTGGSAGIVSAAKGNVTRCVVAGSRISGTNLASFSTAGIISKRNGNTPKAANCAVIGAILQNDGKTILGSTDNLSVEANKWWGVKYLDDSAYVSGGTDQDGDTFATAPTQADFESMGYDFTNTWKWNPAGYPELKNAGCPDAVKNM